MKYIGIHFLKDLYRFLGNDFIFYNICDVYTLRWTILMFLKSIFSKATPANLSRISNSILYFELTCDMTPEFFKRKIKVWICHAFAYNNRLVVFEHIHLLDPLVSIRFSHILVFFFLLLHWSKLYCHYTGLSYSFSAKVHHPALTWP